MPTQLPDPIPCHPEAPNYEVHMDSWLRALYTTSQHLSLVQREGAIQNYDKAGNLDAQYLVFTSSGSANAENTLSHTLNRVPKGWIVVRQDKAGSLYHGSADTAWTTTNLYLKSSVATVAWAIMVF